VRGVSGDSPDSCDLTFGRYLLVPHPREDAWMIAMVDPHDRGMRGYAPPRVAAVGLMRRSYRQPGWLTWATSLRPPGRPVLQPSRLRQALPTGRQADRPTGRQADRPTGRTRIIMTGGRGTVLG
jgi:hypothetical protein